MDPDQDADQCRRQAKPYWSTRRFPRRHRALEEVCDVDLNDGDPFLTARRAVARVRGKQALVAMFTDPVDRAVLEAGLPS